MNILSESDKALKSVYLDMVESEIKGIYKNTIKRIEKEHKKGIFTATAKTEPYPKTGRNEKCPCGSGKKYKHCCLNKKENDDVR